MIFAGRPKLCWYHTTSIKDVSFHANLVNVDKSLLWVYLEILVWLYHCPCCLLVRVEVVTSLNVLADYFFSVNRIYHSIIQAIFKELFFSLAT